MNDLQTPKLVIRKRMQLIQGKVRPTCFVMAKIDPAIQAVLEEHFVNEPLFKRAAYSANWPKGAIDIPAALAPAMSVFLKNDACPEITVKTMLAGQMHQGANVWEMMSFELIAKLSFDNLLALVGAAADLQRENVYYGYEAQRATAAFDADTAAEFQALTGQILAA